MYVGEDSALASDFLLFNWFRKIRDRNRIKMNEST